MPTTTLQVSSPAFEHGASIPVELTAQGDELAPPLAWSPAPPGTRSIAILVEDPDAPDPDAPERILVHWIVTGIPAVVTAIGRELPSGAVAGTNDDGKRAWSGPNPPIGRHRYFFHVFALDIDLRAPGISKMELVAAIRNHVLAHGELVGTFERAQDFHGELRGTAAVHRGYR